MTKLCRISAILRSEFSHRSLVQERLRQQMEDVRLEANEAFRAVEAEDRPEADVEALNGAGGMKAEG